MIQIKKDIKDCPKILINQGKDQTRKDCESFKRASKKVVNKYLYGKKFRNLKYYSNETVKKALMKSHFNKCCYCEQRRRQSELAVEHFRPRTGIKETKKGKLIYPGYFWLAYCWSNLYLSCAECNSRFKGSWFPLDDPTKRAKPCEKNLSEERPLLTDPGLDKPRRHLRFRLDKIYSITRRGKKTIEILKLDEENLRKIREEKIGILQDLLDIIVLAEEKGGAKWLEKAGKARQKLDKAILPQSSFSSMEGSEKFV